MTIDEWEEIVQRLDGAWPLTKERRDLYFELLVDLDANAVQAAITELLREPREKAPPPGVIRDRAQKSIPAYASGQPASEYQTPPAPVDAAGYMRTSAQPASIETSGKATASLVLGILGIVVVPLICSILAIVFGKSALNEIERRPGLRGEQQARWGYVLGWIGVGLMAIVFFIGVIIGVTGAG
jgi:hypothetical protein